MVKVKKYKCDFCKNDLIFLKSEEKNKHLFFCIPCKKGFKKNNLFILNKKNNIHLK